jgi:Fe-S-cluster containining protein
MKSNNLKRLIQELNQYRYKCKENCFECCTWFSFLPEEKKIIDKELKKQWYSEPPNWKWDKYCEYLTEQWRCSIYNARPIICRGFSNHSFILTWNWQKIATQTCTYWEKKLVIASKEFINYWIEVLNKWIYNKNAKNVMEEFINSKPLIDISNFWENEKNK